MRHAADQAFFFAVLGADGAAPDAAFAADALLPLVLGAASLAFAFPGEVFAGAGFFAASPPEPDEAADLAFDAEPEPADFPDFGDVRPAPAEPWPSISARACAQCSSALPSGRPLSSQIW
jgi:hypothetical protein